MGVLWMKVSWLWKHALEPVSDQNKYDRDIEIKYSLHKIDHLLAEASVEEATTAAIVVNFIFDK